MTGFTVPGSTRSLATPASELAELRRQVAVQAARRRLVDAIAAINEEALQLLVDIAVAEQAARRPADVATAAGGETP